MTTQEPDVLIENDQKYMLQSYPLESFFQNHERPSRKMHKTSNHRGYIATWKIEDKKLYLIALRGSPATNQNFSLKTLFPTETSPIFTEWFTGSLFIPHGDRLRNVFRGFTPLYEKQEQIEVEQGMIINRIMRTYDKKSKKYTKISGNNSNA